MRWYEECMILEHTRRKDIPNERGNPTGNVGHDQGIIARVETIQERSDSQPRAPSRSRIVWDRR